MSESGARPTVTSRSGGKVYTADPRVTVNGGAVAGLDTRTSFQRKWDSGSKLQIVSSRADELNDVPQCQCDEQDAQNP